MDNFNVADAGVPATPAQELQFGSQAKLLLESQTDKWKTENKNKFVEGTVAGTVGGLLAEPTAKVIEISADKLTKLPGQGVLRETGRELGRFTLSTVGKSGARIGLYESMWWDATSRSNRLQAIDRRINEISNPQLTRFSRELTNTEHLRVLDRKLGIDPLPQLERRINRLDTRILRMDETVEAAKDSKLISSKAITNSARGVLFTLGTGAVITADHRVRNYLYGSSAPSWETSSLSVPLALTLGRTVTGKTALTAAALAGGHVLDNAIGAPEWIPESLKQFSVHEAIPMAVAFSIPTRNRIVKAGLVGMAWAAGNASETLHEDKEKTAFRASQDDVERRTDASMDRAVDFHKRVAAENESTLREALARRLEVYRDGYATMTPDQKVKAHRDTAAMARALGEHRLAEGTQLTVRGKEKPKQILAGQNLDLGGEALMNLQMAKGNIRNATELTARKDPEHNLSVSKELEELSKTASKIDASIGAIEGKHDIPKAITDLKALISRGTTFNGTIFNKEQAFQDNFIDGLSRKIERQFTRWQGQTDKMPPDTQVLTAKLLRDQALTKMALVSHKIERGDILGAQSLLGNAPNNDEPKWSVERGSVMDSLMAAERLSSRNPDLPDLKKLATALEVQVRERLKQQSQKPNSK